MEKTAYRHEYKYAVQMAECMLLCTRLRAVLATDPHAQNGKYTIRSLYFDDSWDSALAEKEAGVQPRVKFRIRAYNGDDSYICLEKKTKQYNLTQKLQAVITRKQYAQIMAGDIEWLSADGRGLLAEFYTAMCAGLRPRVLVEYDRFPFLYAPGGVRVTLDTNIRTGLHSLDLFGQTPFVRVSPLEVLEVKYDAFLPDIIRCLLAPYGRSRTSASKYNMCRMFDSI